MSIDVWDEDVIQHGVMNRLAYNATLRALARRCWPKVQHATPEDAERHAQALVNRGVHKDLAALRVYHCRHCQGWHVGHVKGEQDATRTEAHQSL